MPTGLMWFRTGLRLEDNLPLHAALAENANVHCLFTLDDHFLRSADIGAARCEFLFRSLRELGDAIEAHGGQLIVRRGADVPSEVIKVAVEVGAEQIYTAADYLPYARQRDMRVADLAEKQGMQLRLFHDAVLVDPSTVLTQEGRPYTVFTPFKRRWESLVSPPTRCKSAPLFHKLKQSDRFPSAEIPTVRELGLNPSSDIVTPGERAAGERLRAFVADGLPVYNERRDHPADPELTSRLSAHIKFGTISIRDCYRAATNAGGLGAAKWIDEIAWREFFIAIVSHFPHVLIGPMLPAYADFPWVDDPDRLEAWRAGQTGYPFVDAGMRQLNATGFMHNRLRQVTASYLCKDLAINWQEGERYFMRMLTDGDWPANSGGWQWVAGCGTDPRRATRIFNPKLQQEKYDPDFEYVRRWVPEYGTTRYPSPIVTHEEGRLDYLDRLARIRV